MAALPKKRHSKARTRVRKATISLQLPRLSTCSKCQSLRFSHRACPKCGYYEKKGRSET